jgi:murein DD-endopeptidase MepM/ murein hydrolase activator NlpD
MVSIISDKKGRYNIYLKNGTYYINNNSYWALTVNYSNGENKGDEEENNEEDEEENNEEEEDFEENNLDEKDIQEQYSGENYIIIPPRVKEYKLNAKKGPWKWSVSFGNRDAKQANIFYYLPFDTNHPRKCTQGNAGFYSHKGLGKYSIDFAVPAGTPVFASRAGTVVETRSDSDKGGPDKSFSDDTNYILIQHDDYTVARYLHLKKDGVSVKEGQRVNAGETIGASGNTGWTTGPHLHLECCIFGTEVFGSIPMTFYDSSLRGYIPLTGVRYGLFGKCEPVIKTLNKKELMIQQYEYSHSLIELWIDNVTEKNYEIDLKFKGNNTKYLRPSLDKSPKVFSDLIPAKTQRLVVTLLREDPDNDWQWDYECDWNAVFPGEDLQELYNRFHQIDRDGNGYIEYCELWHWMIQNPNDSLSLDSDVGNKTTGKNIERKVETLWKKMDTNKDGIVTFYEFVKFLL